MERQKFEDSWKESFKEAEVSPSDSLWTNIELDLEKENAGKMKRRIMFFQLLAAASVAFAMTFAGVGVYFMLQNNDTQPLVSNAPIQSTPSTTGNITSSQDQNTIASAQSETSDKAGINTSTARANTNTEAAQNAASPRRDQPNNAVAQANQSRTTPSAQQPSQASNTSAAGKTQQASPQQQQASALARVDAPTTKSTSDRVASDRTVTDQSTQLAQNNTAENSKRKRATQTTESATPAVAGQQGHNTNTQVAVASASDKATSSGKATAAPQQGQGHKANTQIAAASASDKGTSVSGKTIAGTQEGNNTNTQVAVASVSDKATSASGTTTAAASQEGNNTNAQVAAASDKTTVGKIAQDPAIVASNNSATQNQPVTVVAVLDKNTRQNQVAATTGKQQATTQQSAATTTGTTTTAATDPAVATTTAADRAVAVAEADLSKTQGTLPVLANPAEPSLVTTAAQEADPVALMLARLDDQEKQYAQQEKDNKKKDKGTERLWTSLGFAAGAYNMVTSGGNGSAAAASSFDQQAFAATSNNALTNSIVHEQSSAPGVAYTVGLNLGTKLAARWVLQGGVNYLTQSSNYTTSAAVGTPDNAFKPASINELDKISSSGRQEARVISTAAYRVNSNLQYFSVPVQAGYLVVNRAFGLQLNAGVSTDLFLRNTLTPDGGSLEKTTQTRADDSPYRPLNFSGLVGTEFSYRFGPHYRVAINPGLRYPFSSIYNSDISVNAMPLTFDVGLKFRYIFH